MTPMKTQTQRIAITALLCALTVIVLYISSVVPTLRLVLIASAGLLPAVIVLRYGIPSGFVLYAIASVMAFILLPSKGNALLYILVFGHYPMLKSLIERIDKVWLEWILKISLFNVLASVLILFFSTVVVDIIKVTYAVPVLFTLGNAAFVIYDIGFTGLIAVFIKRFKQIK